jgi:GAF domain-containing protein
MNLECSSSLGFLNDISLLSSREYQEIPEFLGKVLLRVVQVIPSDFAAIAYAEGESNQWSWVTMAVGALPITSVMPSGQDGPRSGGVLGNPPCDLALADLVAFTGKCQQQSRTSPSRAPSQLSTPVILDNVILGVIAMSGEAPGLYSSEHEAILGLTASLIAPRLHRLSRRQTIRASGIDVVEKIGDRLSSIPPGIPLRASGVLDQVAAIAADALHSSLCQIWLLDGERLENRGQYWEAQYNNEVAPDCYEFATQSVEQRSLLSLAPTGDRRSLPLGLSGGGTSPKFPLLVAPMTAFGHPLGAIVVGKRKLTYDVADRRYTGADVHLLNIIQAQVAASAEIKRLEMVRRDISAGRMQQVSSLSTVFVELDLKTVLKKTVLRASELCNAQYCSVFLWNELRKEFVLAESNGLQDDLIGAAAYAPVEGLTGWVAKHGKALLLDSRAREDLALVAPDLAWRSKYREGAGDHDLSRHPFAGTPIYRDGRVVGVLRMSGRVEGSFTEADEFVMTLVASKISSAIAYSERYEERVRLLKGLEALLSDAAAYPRKSAGESDFRQVLLRQSARQAVAVFKPDIVVIYPTGGAKLEVPPVWLGEMRSPEQMWSDLTCDSVAVKVLDGSECHYWSDARSAENLVRPIRVEGRQDAPPRFVVREGVVSSAAIPCKVGSTVVGVMFLNYRTPQTFDYEKRQMLVSFATQVALSLEIAALYRDIRESASREEAFQLACELHDVVTMLSHEVVIRAGLVLDQLKSGALNEVAADAKAIEKYAAECAAELRGIMGELHKETGETIDEQLLSLVQGH